MPLAAAILSSILLAVPSSGAAPPDADSSRLAQSSGELRVGSQMPSFAGWTMGGELWSSQRHRVLYPGRPLVIAFFATWCQPCIRSLPMLERLRASLPPESVTFLLIAFGERADIVAPFAERHGLRSVVLLDPFSKIGARFGVERALPRTFVVDGTGTVSAIFVAEGVDFETALRSELDRASR